MHDVPDIPAYDAPDAAFVFSDPIARDAAMWWAQSVFADVAHHPDRQLAQACRVIIANKGEQAMAAEMLLDMLDVSHAA